MTIQLSLPDSLRQQMFEHALSRPSQEVCGLLGGRREQASSYYPVKNAAPEPARRYLMEPAEQIAAMKDMRDRGETLVGIFHSHTDTPARPSPTDLALAYYPDTVYLILSLQSAPPELNAFYFDGGQFRQVSITAAGGRQ